MDEYYLHIEWNRIQHQVLLLFLYSFINYKCWNNFFTYVSEWEWTYFVLTTFLIFKNIFLNNIPKIILRYLTKNIFNNISVVTFIRSPSMSLQAKIRQPITKVFITLTLAIHFCNLPPVFWYDFCLVALRFFLVVQCTLERPEWMRDL